MRCNSCTNISRAFDDMRFESGRFSELKRGATGNAVLMEAKQTKSTARVISAGELLPQLRTIPLFSNVNEHDMECLGDVELLEIAAGTTLINPGEAELYFWVVVQGEVRATKPEAEGGCTLLGTLKTGDTFGEVPLLTGAPFVPVQVQAVTDSKVARVKAAAFWNLMSTCPVVRAGVLANMGRRLEAYQVITLHREKLISLGTLAAGLMHELNNPGAAARRASAQLRDNLVRLQEISLRFTQAKLTAEQLGCMSELQAEALKFQKPQAMSSLEQSDAEEELAAWLEHAGVENAWKIAPTLAGVGWNKDDIACAQRAFPQSIFSDALNWLEALVSSLQLVSTIEESITRVTDLVVAVKKYAYDEKSREREIDVHESIQGTLTILGHKFREKQLTVHKVFSAEMPKIKITGTGLSQVWTNLLDNAIDASPEGGEISIRTWVEKSGVEKGTAEKGSGEKGAGENGTVCIGIADKGSGIAPENRDHIFEPFFTTKPAGVGTGLGLDIVHRVVVGQFGGEITFTSEPGNTEFIVRLPTTRHPSNGAAAG